MFIRLLVLFVTMVFGDLIAYNRGVNNNYQLKNMRKKLQNYRRGHEAHYGATVAMYLMERGDIENAKSVVLSSLGNTKKAAQFVRRRRSMYNKFMKKNVKKN